MPSRCPFFDVWRALGLILAALVVGLTPVLSRDVTDATEHTSLCPMQVFAAGPPAAVRRYALKPKAMIGWLKAPKNADFPI